MGQTATVTRLVLVAVVAALAVLAGCGGDDAPSGCGPDVRERIDPSSAVHVLPGAPEPEYLSDPPTSGPHGVGPVPAGAQVAPLDRPTQVRILEAGRVLLQHEGLTDDQRAALETLASEDVVVAPGRDLPGAVVATAWGSKRVCEMVAEDPLQDFVDDHRGQPPGPG